MSFGALIDAVWTVVGTPAILVLVVVGVAGLLDRMIDSVIWRRTIWQVCWAALATVLALEASGMGRYFEFKGWGAERELEQSGHSQASVPLIAALEEPASMASPASAASNSALLLNDEFRTRVTAKVSSDKASTAARSPLDSLPDSTADLKGLIAPKPLANGGDSSFAIDRAGSTPLPVWVGFVWLAGTLILLMRSLMGRLLFLVFKLHTRPVRDPELVARVQTLAGQLGYDRRIRLIESPRLPGPVAFGVIQPTIGLPSEFKVSFESSEQETILAHELAHHAARDPVWRFVSDLVIACWWWHPLVWWARRQWQQATELAADEASLLVRNGPGVLAESLLKLGTRLVRTRTVGWLGIDGRGFRSGLGQRVSRLMNLRGGRWSPPPARVLLLSKIAGSVVLALIALVCVGWCAPDKLSHGGSMNTLKKSWKRSWATIALIGAVMPPGGAAGLASADDQAPPDRVPSQTVSGSRENHFKNPWKNGLAQQQPVPGSAAQPSDAQPNRPQYRMDPELMKRYGLLAAPVPPAADSAVQPAPNDVERRKILAQLDQIVLKEVLYDDVPLEEVLKDLQNASTRNEERTINFLIANTRRGEQGDAGADPVTGMPLAPAAHDIAHTSIRFTLPLRNVKMKDVLNAIVRVAEQPIQYSIEEYGIVFYPGLGYSAAPPPPAPYPSEHSGVLTVRTFRVDTNTFLKGMERAFGIAPVKDSKADRVQVTGMLRAMLEQLGIRIDSPQKWVFYNDVTGIILVRGTFDELQIVEAAVQTLGGGPAHGFGGEPGAALGPGMPGGGGFGGNTGLGDYGGAGLSGGGGGGGISLGAGGGLGVGGPGGIGPGPDPGLGAPGGALGELPPPKPKVPKRSGDPK